MSYICANNFIYYLYTYISYIYIYMILKQKLNNSRRKITSRDAKLEDKSILVILSVIHAG